MLTNTDADSSRQPVTSTNTKQNRTFFYDVQVVLILIVT